MFDGSSGLSRALPARDFAEQRPPSRNSRALSGGMLFWIATNLDVARSTPSLRRRLRDLLAHVFKILGNRGHTKL